MKNKVLYLAPMESGQANLTPKPELTNDYFSRCAFAYAYALLWDGKNMSSTEKRNCLRLLKNFFQNCQLPRQGLLMFCQRVQLEKIGLRIPLVGSVFACNPSLWLEETLALDGHELKSWYSRLLHARIQTFGYRKDENLLALQYLAYIINPTVRTFRKGRKRLLPFRASGVVETYYHVVLFYNYMIG